MLRACFHGEFSAIPPRNPRASGPAVAGGRRKALKPGGRGSRADPGDNGGFAFPMESAVSARPLFHLAFPVHDLAAARRFYGDLLGCPEGRSSDAWVDFDFYGHQVVAHLAPDEVGHRVTSAVDGDDVPVRHFGAILSMAEWEALAAKLKAAGTRFIIEPHVRFKGQVGEQATMFFLDPSGNALEFKAFGDLSQVFAK